jgi:(p)ppGpp synthase/HD superfamily hydrolase
VPNKYLVETVSAALLHDTLEDDPRLTPEIFRKRFGLKIFMFVDPITKPDYKTFPGKTSWAKKWALDTPYVRRIMGSPIQVRLVKLADRLNNLISTHSMVANGAVDGTGKISKKVIYYILETETFYLPLAKATSFYYYKRLRIHLEALKKLVPDWENARAELLGEVENR